MKPANRREIALVRAAENSDAIFLATPRIQKADETGFFRLIETAAPDGVLVRNLRGLDQFRNSLLRLVGDFSLNVANPLTAEALLREARFERLTVSPVPNARRCETPAGDVIGRLRVNAQLGVTRGTLAVIGR